jgi:hypothetical protein
MNTLPQLAEEIDKLKAKCCCGSSFKTITYEKAITLIATSKVKPGTLYRITGVHKNKVGVTIPVLYDDGSNSGTTIYVWGLTKTEFSTEGWGEFYNPKYDQTNYGNPDLRVGQALDITTPGSDYSTTSNVAVTGGSGTGMTVNVIDDSGGLVSVIINTLGTGYANGDVITIADGNDDAIVTLNVLPYLYNIYDGENPSITGTNTPIGRKCFWGEYVWTNTTGQMGSAISVTELDPTNWTKVAYNLTDYNFVIDYIEYDWQNDWLLRRRQAEPVIDIIFPFQFWNSPENTQGIVLHGISVAQWGNKYNKDTELGSGLVICNDAYFEFCNFKGKQLLGATLGNYSFIKDNYRGIDTKFKGLILNNYSFQMNSIFDTGAYQYYIQIDNASGQTDMHLFNECYQDNIRISNKSSQVSWLRNKFDNEDPAVSYQKNIVLDNNVTQYIECYAGSYQHNVCILNASSQSIILKLASFQYFMTLDNASNQNVEFSGFSQQYGTITDVASQIVGIGGLLTNGSQTYFLIRNAVIDYDGGTFSPINVEYEETSKELIYKFKTQFSGGANDGQVGAFTLPDMIISNEFFISQVIVESVGLTAGGGAYLTMGIETDDVDAALNSTTGLVATLTATPIQMITPTYTKSGGVRKLVAAVGGATISAGLCNFIIKCTKLY